MTIKIDGDALNPRERRFVEEYLIDFSQAKAALRAGYSPKGAATTANRLMKKEAVQRAITTAVKQSLDKFRITRERVLAEYARLAFSDLGDAIDIAEDGTATVNLARIRENKDFRAAVAEISQSDVDLGKDRGTERRTKIKLHQKKGALDALAKYLRLMPADRVEVTGDDGGPMRTEATIDLKGLSIEELAALSAMAKKVGKQP